jgi:hypothetical protein
MIGGYGSLAIAPVAANHRPAGVYPAVAFPRCAIPLVAANYRSAGVYPAVALP